MTENKPQSPLPAEWSADLAIDGQPITDLQAAKMAVWAIVGTEAAVEAEFPESGAWLVGLTPTMVAILEQQRYLDLEDTRLGYTVSLKVELDAC